MAKLLEKENQQNNKYLFHYAGFGDSHASIFWHTSTIVVFAIQGVKICIL